MALAPIFDNEFLLGSTTSEVVRSLVAVSKDVLATGGKKRHILDLKKYERLHIISRQILDTLVFECYLSST